MNRYDNLLQKIADDLGIIKGDKETLKSFKERIIYSSVCQNAYASLFDEVEDEEFITITHFKNRIKRTIKAYREMYPEVLIEMNSDESIITIADSLEYIFRRSGSFYHSPNRIAPPIPTVCTVGDIHLTRGYSLSDDYFLSGAGAYSTNDNMPTDDVSIFEYSGISNKPLAEIWKLAIKGIHWHRSAISNDRIEFLNDKDFYSGYWSKSPTKDGTVSILRTTDSFSKIYYFYRYNSDDFEVSQVPEWMLYDDEGYGYLLLANSFFHYHNKLPQIKYSVDGSIAYLKAPYFLPVQIKCFLDLYSWPIGINNTDIFSGRIIDARVFGVIQMLLKTKGYDLKEDDKICQTAQMQYI